MTLETDLKKFWDGYQPVLRMIEASDADTNTASLLAQVTERSRALKVPDSWTVQLFNERSWYDGLLVREIAIPACRGKKGRKRMTITVRPKYNEEKDRIYWDSVERQAERDICIRGGMPAYDFDIDLKPQIRPRWQRHETARAADFVQHRSHVGTIEASIEEGSGVFKSCARAELLRQEDAKPSTFVEKGEIKYREPLKACLIAVRLGYRNTEGLSQGETNDAMEEMWSGYQWISSISFQAKDMGSGEIDRFLEHLGIRYQASCEKGDAP